MTPEGDQPEEASATSGMEGAEPPSILVYNERIKYTATWVNTIAAGVIIAGFVAPLAALATSGASALAMLFSSVWLLVGAALHYLVRRLLLDLREEN